MSAIDSSVGSVDWFTSTFWCINPIGSIENAYYWANNKIATLLDDGSFLTWEELLKRYTDFYNYMFSMQNEKFTKKEHKLLTIEEYCYGNHFRSNYSKMLSNSCDAYLFGI